MRRNKEKVAKNKEKETQRRHKYKRKGRGRLAREANTEADDDKTEEKQLSFLRA